MVLLDNELEIADEAVVSLTQQQVISYEEIQDVQPTIMLEEFIECEELVKATLIYSSISKTWH